MKLRFLKRQYRRLVDQLIKRNKQAERKTHPWRTGSHRRWRSLVRCPQTYEFRSYPQLVCRAPLMFPVVKMTREELMEMYPERKP